MHVRLGEFEVTDKGAAEHSGHRWDVTITVQNAVPVRTLFDQTGLDMSFSGDEFRAVYRHESDAPCPWRRESDSRRAGVQAAAWLHPLHQSGNQEGHASLRLFMRVLFTRTLNLNLNYVL